MEECTSGGVEELSVSGVQTGVEGWRPLWEGAAPAGVGLPFIVQPHQ